MALKSAGPLLLEARLYHTTASGPAAAVMLSLLGASSDSDQLVAELRGAKVVQTIAPVLRRTRSPSSVLSVLSRT